MDSKVDSTYTIVEQSALQSCTYTPYGCTFTGDQHEQNLHQQTHGQLHLMLVMQRLHQIQQRKQHLEIDQAVQNASTRLSQMRQEHYDLLEQYKTIEGKESSEEVRKLKAILRIAYPGIDFGSMLSMVIKRNHAITKLEAQAEKLEQDIRNLEQNVQTESDDDDDDTLAEPQLPFMVWKTVDRFESSKLPNPLRHDPRVLSPTTPLKEILKYRDFSQMNFDEMTELMELLDDESAAVIGAALVGDAHISIEDDEDPPKLIKDIIRIREERKRLMKRKGTFAHKFLRSLFAFPGA